MSIPYITPQEAVRMELRLLASIVFLATGFVFLIIWLGVRPVNPQMTTGEMILMLREISLIAIPCVVSVVFLSLAMITNLGLFEGLFNIDGYTPGETGFIFAGVWIGASLAMFVTLSGDTTYTPQVATWISCSMWASSFAALAMIWRRAR